MTIKVLVFESDPAFADELRTELGTLGCATTVVDDGNVGLQRAAAEKPDLILLSIELPRMNGFSVCNKLKKDPTLKDVPLIIMSAESSDETFDQHKKLRTRAEDYVHKPIAFAELQNHIQQFVNLGASPPDSDAAILVEEIEVGSADYLIDEQGEDAAAASLIDNAGDAATDRNEPVAAVPPAAAARRWQDAADDVDALAETAFSRLTGFDGPTQSGSDTRAAPNGSAPPDLGITIQPMGSVTPPIARRASVRPVPPGTATVDANEHERLRAEYVLLREQTETVQRELGEARRSADKLRIEAAEAGRLGREVDELRAKLSAATKSGGISSRDFRICGRRSTRRTRRFCPFVSNSPERTATSSSRRTVRSRSTGPGPTWKSGSSRSSDSWPKRRSSRTRLPMNATSPRRRRRTCARGSSGPRRRAKRASGRFWSCGRATPTSASQARSNSPR